MVAIHLSTTHCDHVRKISPYPLSSSRSQTQAPLGHHPLNSSFVIRVDATPRYALPFALSICSVPHACWLASLLYHRLSPHSVPTLDVVHLLHYVVSLFLVAKNLGPLKLILFYPLCFFLSHPLALCFSLFSDTCSFEH